MGNNSTIYSINYYNTFITVADDYAYDIAHIPPDKTMGKTIAGIQFELLFKNPYKYTSDDIAFFVYAERANVPSMALSDERSRFFSKQQSTLIISPLPKRYGWGIHSNAEGKVALFAMESDKYAELKTDNTQHQLKALRSRKQMPRPLFELLQERA